RVVLTGNRQLVLVRAVGDVLVMDLLRFPEEVRAPAWEGAVRSPVATSATPEEQLASRLATLSG
ncbi:MAG: hypothetical protein HY040_24715, partial [Planctomycetes bacterium]|nr:hypothetical protein [Planctomycetota bacterium]